MNNTPIQMPFQTRVEHHWYAGRSFDIWHIEAGTKEERYAFSVDAATVCTGTLQDCKAAWIRELARVQKGAATYRDTPKKEGESHD